MHDLALQPRTSVRGAVGPGMAGRVPGHVMCEDLSPRRPDLAFIPFPAIQCGRNHAGLETRDFQRNLRVACHAQTQNDEKTEDLFEIQNHVYRIIFSE